MNKRQKKKNWKKARERARLEALRLDPADLKLFDYFLLFGEVVEPGVGVFYKDVQIADAAGQKIRHRRLKGGKQ